MNLPAILKYAGGLLLLIGIVNPILQQYGYTVKNIPTFGWGVGIGIAVAGAALLVFGFKMDMDKKKGGQ